VGRKETYPKLYTGNESSASRREYIHHRLAVHNTRLDSKLRLPVICYDKVVSYICLSLQSGLVLQFGSSQRKPSGLGVQLQRKQWIRPYSSSQKVSNHGVDVEPIAQRLKRRALQPSFPKRSYIGPKKREIPKRSEYPTSR
jgi:hypothetical protein